MELNPEKKERDMKNTEQWNQGYLFTMKRHVLKPPTGKINNNKNYTNNSGLWNCGIRRPISEYKKIRAQFLRCLVIVTTLAGKHFYRTEKCTYTVDYEMRGRHPGYMVKYEISRNRPGAPWMVIKRTGTHGTNGAPLLLLRYNKDVYHLWLARVNLQYSEIWIDPK